MRLNYASSEERERSEARRKAMRFRDPTEWLIAALCQFDCNSLRSIEGRECGARRRPGSGRILRQKREVIRCLGIIVRNNFSLSRHCEIIVERSGRGERFAKCRCVRTCMCLYTCVYTTVMDSRSLSVRSARGTVRNYNLRECFTTPSSIVYETPFPFFSATRVSPFFRTTARSRWEFMLYLSSELAWRFRKFRDASLINLLPCAATSNQKLLLVT